MDIRPPQKRPLKVPQRTTVQPAPQKPATTSAEVPKPQKKAHTFTAIFSRIQKLWTHYRPRTKKDIAIWLLGIVVLILAFNHFKPQQLLTNDGTIKVPTLKNRTGKLTKGTPEYATLLPAGHTIADYGGWTRVSPPERDPVFAYVDKIGNIPINVSQQPLPKDLADQPDEQIQLLAQGYSANEVLHVGETTVYLGTSAKGPQSVIFTKNKLLFLIKATAKIPDASWTQYVSSLR